MLLGLTYQLMRFITDLVLVRTRSDAQLRAEVLALRHQLRVLERKVGKPAWQPADRILLAGLSRLLPKSGLPSLLPKPETLLRWHRDLVCHKWAAFHDGVPYTSVRQLDQAAQEYSRSKPPRRSKRTVLPPTGSGTTPGSASGQR